MGQRTRFLLTWIGLSAIIILALGAITLFFAIDGSTSEYRSRAEKLAWQLADRAAFDLRQGGSQGMDFLTSAFVLGNVLYAQVVNNGLIVSQESLLQSTLPTAARPYEIFDIDSIRLDGQSIWDVRRIVPNTNAYVRVGLSLRPLENIIRFQVLVTLGVGLGLLALVAMIVDFFSRRLERAAQTIPAQAQPAVGSLHEFGSAAPALQTHGISRAAPDADVASSSAQTANSWISAGELLIDDVSKRVELRGHYVELSPKEFDLVLLLAKEPGRVYSNQEILEHVWADSHMATAQDVKQYIYFLRQKLEQDPKDPRLIVTVRGFGYKLQV